MKIESKLILTSKNAVTGVNLYTFVLTYPRMILAEVNTHRMLSRNAASSRAIPAKKQRKQVLADPFVPSIPEWWHQHRQLLFALGWHPGCPNQGTKIV